MLAADVVLVTFLRHRHIAHVSVENAGAVVPVASG